MPLRSLLSTGSWYCIFCAFSVAAAAEQSTHYSVKLAPDFERQLLRGDETIEFQVEAGAVEWQKQAGLHVLSADLADGEVTVAEHAVRGLRWFADHAGLATAFYCEAWMVCDNSPGRRATLQLEIAVPFTPPAHGANGFRAVGPGRRGKEWRGRDGDHFVF